MQGQSNPKRVLLFFPHDVSDRKRGVNVRLSMILDYLKNNYFQVDLLSLRNFERVTSSESSTPSTRDFSRRILYNHANGLRIGWIRNVIHLDFSANPNLLGKKIQSLPDYAYPGLQRLFQRTLQENAYDYVIISYVQWARLLEPFKERAFRAIITIEDCLSDNLIQNDTDPRLYHAFLSEEARRIELFDDAVFISHEEMEMFAGKALSPSHHYIPVFLRPCMLPFNRTIEFDLLFVGSDHPSNKRGIAWFFNSVFPALPEGTRIMCVGRIVQHIGEYRNVTKKEFEEDISEAYSRSRIAIIPLLDGTGMKVKLIEALAHGVPVVTTTAGLSGIPGELRKQFITADDPGQFAQAVGHLLTDRQFYSEYTETLRKLFDAEFSTAAVTARLDRVFPK